MKPLAAGSTRLTHGDFERAQARGAEYILNLDPDKLLAPVRREAGLPDPGESYGNWENSGLDGHTLGHVLSAAAHLFSATEDVRALGLVDNLVVGIKDAQDHLGTGYVGGVPHGQELWERIAQGNVEPDSFGLNGAWVPWYNLHKLFAGLIDVHKLTASAAGAEQTASHEDAGTDNDTSATSAVSAQALAVVTRLADWWVAIARTMPDEAFESMLRTEFGAMNAAFADLFELTGTEDYVWLARRFSDRALLDPLIAGEHILPGLHANTQIAKAFGYARVGAVYGDAVYTRAGAQLWKQVIERHTYVFGGNSVREHFTDSLHAGFGSEQGPETCNTYNMLRLTRELLAAAPEDLEAAGITTDALLDYYERALFNHIASSQHPDTGGLVYFTPVRPDHYRVYSQAQECFWCCVGTGMENHVRTTELIYGTDQDTLYVNFAIASTARWDEVGLEFEQVNNIALSHELVLRVVRAPERELTIAIRLPWWSRRNNQTSWRRESRRWSAGEEIRVPLAKRTTAHIISDDTAHSQRWVAFQRGPFALAARTSDVDMPGLHADDSRMGHVAHGAMHPLVNTPIVVAEEPVNLGVVDQVKVVFAEDIETAMGDSALHAALRAVPPAPGIPTVALAVAIAHSEEIADSEDVADSVTPSTASAPESENPKTSVALEPLLTVHDSRYTLYFPLATDNLEQVRAGLAQLDAHTLRDQLFLLDQVEAGEQQPESDHAFAGAHTQAHAVGAERWRDAGLPADSELPASSGMASGAQATTSAQATSDAFFSYALRTNGEVPARLSLLVGYQDDASAMRVLVNGQELAVLELPARPIESEPPHVHDIEIPQELIGAAAVQDAASDAGPATVTVAFSVIGAGLTPRVHRLQLLKAAQ